MACLVEPVMAYEESTVTEVWPSGWRLFTVVSAVITTFMLFISGVSDTSAGARVFDDSRHSNYSYFCSAKKQVRRSLVSKCLNPVVFRYKFYASDSVVSSGN